MSWSRLAWLLPVALVAVLAGCSGFRPVYGDVASASNPQGYRFHYAAPASRLDQIVYNELRLRLGPNSNEPDALQVTVSAWSGARGLTRTAVSKPVTTNEMIVYASYTVATPTGEVLVSETRSASGLYTTRDQVLGDVEGQNEAAERGAKAVSDTVRLGILGALARLR